MQTLSHTNTFQHRAFRKYHKYPGVVQELFRSCDISTVWLLATVLTIRWFIREDTAQFKPFHKPAFSKRGLSENTVSIQELFV